jgi:hypothetical protein
LTIREKLRDVIKKLRPKPDDAIKFPSGKGIGNLVALPRYVKDTKIMTR